MPSPLPELPTEDASLEWPGHRYETALRPGSGMFEHDSFEDVRHVLSAVCRPLEELVDLAPFDDGLGVRLVALEELGEPAAHGVVRLVLEAVDLVGRGDDPLQVLLASQE